MGPGSLLSGLLLGQSLTAATLDCFCLTVPSDCSHFGLLLSDCTLGPGSADARKMDFVLKRSFSRYALKL